MTRPDFDHWLREALRANPEPDDAGFSLRVMAALPPQPRPTVTLAPWWRPATALALASAGIGLGALALFASAWPLAEQAMAAVSLWGLLLWWCLPQSSGSAWR
jgi:negative regulator of sigma E activity